jgi:primosomal protein N' (replication factor Y) (superfamily II helicase)
MNQFADIVALTNGDPTKSVFTYATNDLPLQVGQYVSIPYGKKEIFGVVIDLHDRTPDFQTRGVSSIVIDEIALPSHLIKTARWMAEYYHEPLRNCIDTVLMFDKKVRLKKSSSIEVSAPAPHIIFREEQQKAYDTIVRSLNKFKSFLLFGITGSGKTEIYLQVIAAVLQQQRQVIYLVPEIALTPQTISRIESRFPGKTSVVNSQISDGERYKAFLDCVSGEKPIVIGSRSALFAPFPNLGLIIIDEEHDNSYKQDSSPHYHAVNTAEQMAEQLNIPLILGSATPRMEEYTKSIENNGTHVLLTLESRVLDAKLPKVHIVDMREELKKRNYSTLSDDLESALRSALERNEQSILFLNKRGIASSVVCRMCGWTAECPRCAVALTLHKELYGALSNKLVCHHCDHLQEMVHQCPNCSSLYVKALGSGTERIEQDLNKIFPKARILRMDRDTTSRKGSHEKIYTEFVGHKADILIGTQMITKGWDIPNVTLVGIVSADTALHMPHFKSAEQTFSLITQVAGRAGRGEKQGLVILQTYNPEHYAILAAAEHSFNKFYKQEIEYRKQLLYPPFSQLAQLVYADVKEEKAAYKAEQLAKQLLKKLEELELQAEILGPSTGLIPKLRNKWYYQILVRGEKAVINQLLNVVPIDWKINVDPESAV